MKGPKFRESEGICWNKARDSIQKGVLESIDKWASSKGFQSSMFTEWRNKLFEIVDNKISMLKTQLHPRRSSKVLSDSNVTNYLNELQEKYVMVPIDKADSNIAFICKRYYVEVLTKELGLGGNSTNTYAYVSNTNLHDIVGDHKKSLLDEFKQIIPEEMQALPDIYWLPKLHNC